MFNMNGNQRAILVMVSVSPTVRILKYLGQLHWTTKVACLGTGLAVTYHATRIHAQLYNDCNPYEYVPGEYDLIRRRTIAVVKHFISSIKLNLSTVFGLYSLNVRDLSEQMNSSVERNPDMRPMLIPNQASIELISVASQHSHKNSAMYRSSANSFMVELARRSGLKPYNVSRSNRDLDDGNRYYYHAKDIGIEYSDDEVVKETCFVFTDVDYYADIPRWLRLFKPMMMYSFVPKSLNGGNTEFKYYIDNNRVNYHVSGGGHYQHNLWDYKGDVVTCVDDDGYLLLYDVDQREIKGDVEHRIIWLLPRAKIKDPIWRRLRVDWRDDLVKRKNMVNGGMNYLWEPIDDMLSIGVLGTKYAVDISGKLYEAINIRLSAKEDTIYVSDVERMMKESKHENCLVDAPILFKAYCLGIDIGQNVVKTTKFSTNFSALPMKNQLVTEDAKKVGRAITSPLVTSPALFAAKGYNADVACIEGRIEKVRNRKPWQAKYKEYARLFVDLLVPADYRSTGVPLSSGQVNELQGKPLQRARFKRVAPMMSIEIQNKLKTFIKTETYASAKAPRNITTMSPELTIQLSAYTYAFAELLKKHPWYCPGKRPTEIIRRLADVLKNAEEIEEGDYTCMDGSISEPYLRHVFEPAIMSFFPMPLRPMLKRLLDLVYRRVATTSNGHNFDPEYTIRSGCPFTSQKGSVCNAFNIFCALCEMGYSPVEAFAKIGAVFGDDSVNENYGRNFHLHLRNVVKDMGMIYKSILRQRGEPIQFLGRYFVDPTTKNDSFADPMRTISKLHASTSTGISREQAAANKAIGYLSTDFNTPVISDWAKSVLRITSISTMKGATGEEQYKASNSWPQGDRTSIIEAMSKVMQVDASHLNELSKKLRDVNDLDRFPLVFVNDYNHTQWAIVDGELIGKGPPHNQCDEQPKSTASDSGIQSDDTPSPTSSPSPEREPNVGFAKRKGTPKGRGTATPPANRPRVRRNDTKVKRSMGTRVVSNR